MTTENPVGAAPDAKMNWPAIAGGKFTETSVESEENPRRNKIPRIK
jgi:hypothetical protein